MPMPPARGRERPAGAHGRAPRLRRLALDGSESACWSTLYAWGSHSVRAARRATTRTPRRRQGGRRRAGLRSVKLGRLRPTWSDRSPAPGFRLAAVTAMMHVIARHEGDVGPGAGDRIGRMWSSAQVPDAVYALPVPRWISCYSRPRQLRSRVRAGLENEKCQKRLALDRFEPHHNARRGRRPRDNLTLLPVR